MLAFSPCLVAIILAATGVEAGSRLWQPRITHAKAAVAAGIAVRDLSGVTNIYFNGTNFSSTQHGHQKRYFGLNTPSGSSDYPRLWPNGNIDACFDTATHTHNGVNGVSTRDILYDNLIAARELWRQAGLDDKGGSFQFNILADNDPGCARALRSTHLLIIYAGENVRKMSSTVGVIQPLGEPGGTGPSLYLGPSMTLTDILDIGMMNVVANYAHEMGHVWGLHHEHQNPKWWTTPFSDTERDKIYFSEANFHCENLADFADHMVGYSPTGPEAWRYTNERNSLCRKHAYAERSKFAGGINYLPMDSEGMIDGDKSEPDWDSIMLYPSNAGGRTVGGVKQNVITKPNGDLIQPNSKPSQQDVKGLKKMYGVKIDRGFIGNLGASTSKFLNKVKTIRKKDPDASCL
ncbi:hypothetical protein NEMBOFW57_009201 [Staphylotrichum longicolle]|uniref:Uncharacterized protein n=1 Tax=Staphylotrichum longicolle TaxID=669026 RepID=A0AAD4EX04_9PEZI|nr:hypothetical protein NEMBOFW57_009201 [Staphylotrichum longicolle]